MSQGLAVHVVKFHFLACESQFFTRVLPEEVSVDIVTMYTVTRQWALHEQRNQE